MKRRVVSCKVRGREGKVLIVSCYGLCDSGVFLQRRSLAEIGGLVICFRDGVVTSRGNNSDVTTVCVRSVLIRWHRGDVS